MAPIKPKTVKGKKPAASALKGKPSSKPKKSGPPPKAEQVKTKRATTTKKKRKVYSEKELDIPTLNMITPAGVQKPKGKKKGKIFVDDQESMMTILAMVNAEKEGQIESKIMKSRQMEEIREARRQEAEARQDHRKKKFDETKDAIRKGRKGKPDTAVEQVEEAPKKSASSGKKRVSFG